MEAYVCSSQSSNWNVATWESHGMMLLRNQSARCVFGGLLIGRPKCNSCFLSKQQNRLWFAWCFELFAVRISFASSMNLLIYHQTSHTSTPAKKTWLVLQYNTHFSRNQKLWLLQNTEHAFSPPPTLIKRWPWHDHLVPPQSPAPWNLRESYCRQSWFPPLKEIKVG